MVFFAFLYYNWLILKIQFNNMEKEVIYPQEMAGTTSAKEKEGIRENSEENNQSSIEEKRDEATNKLKEPNLSKEDVYQTVEFLGDSEYKIKFLRDASYTEIENVGVPVKSKDTIDEVMAELYDNVGDRKAANMYWYHTINKERVLEYLKSKDVAEKILEIHNYHPEIIFVTQSSATLFGWLIKEAWRNAWPDEQTPPIVTIDVRPIKRWKDGYLDAEKILSERGYSIKTPQEYQEQLINKTEEILRVHRLEKSLAIVEEGILDGNTAETSKMILEKASKNLNVNPDINIVNLEINSRARKGPFQKYYDFHKVNKRAAYEGNLALNRSEKEIAKQRIDVFKYCGKQIGLEIARNRGV